MRAIALSLTLLALPVVPAGADSPAATAKIHKVFDIVRGNDKIGTDTIDIEQQNDTTTVKIKTDLSVKVMYHRGLSLRTFLQRNLEERSAYFL